MPNDKPVTTIPDVLDLWHILHRPKKDKQTGNEWVIEGCNKIEAAFKAVRAAAIAECLQATKELLSDKD